jgi:hypothetical protein
MTAIARPTGLLLGLSLALVALVQARVPAGTGEVPAYASLKAEAAVELGIAPAGSELLHDRVIEPGTSVSGLLEVSNLSGEPVAAKPRLRALRGELPATLPVELRAGTKTLYSGSLGDFDASLRLGPRAEQRLRLRLSMPRDGARGLQGRSVALIMRFAARKADG